MNRRRRGGLEQQVLATLAAADRALTPAEVLGRLDAGLAYTTVMTVLTRLTGKGLVTRGRAGRAYAYRPIRGESQLTAHRMRLLLESGDDRAAVLAQFVDELSAEDERRLIDLLGGPAEPDNQPPR